MAFIMLQKIIQINAVLLNFLLIKESCEKCKNGEHKHFAMYDYGFFKL